MRVLPFLPCEFRIVIGNRQITVRQHGWRASFRAMLGSVLEQKCRACEERRHRLVCRGIVENRFWIPGPMGKPEESIKGWSNTWGAME